MLKGKKSNLVYKGLVFLGNIGILFFVLFPIFALILGSIQTEVDLYTNIMKLIPEHITLKNYKALFFGKLVTPFQPGVIKFFPRAFKNSIIIAISVTFLNLLIGSLSAYSIARTRFRGKRIITYAILCTRMVPITVLIISLYIILRKFHLLNTLIGVIITLSGFIMPYTIWILIAYFQSLPRELEDAARLDGCGRLGTLIRIVIPLSTPGITASGVIIFMLSWIEFFIPFILTSKLETMTLPLLIASCITDFTVPYPLICAAGVYALLPTVVVVIFMRKYVIKGLTTGALKG